MATYNLHLQPQPFESIKEKTKTVEMRLFDEKRKLYKKGDILVFTNIKTQEQLAVKIKFLKKYKNFINLYKAFDKTVLGYDKNDVANYKDMEKYYPKDKQEEYGVVAIGIEVVN